MCQYPGLTPFMLGVTEGLNPKIQSIKALARGFRPSLTIALASSFSVESLIFSHYKPGRASLNLKRDAEI